MLLDGLKIKAGKGIDIITLKDNDNVISFKSSDIASKEIPGITRLANKEEVLSGIDVDKAVHIKYLSDAIGNIKIATTEELGTVILANDIDILNPNSEKVVDVNSLIKIINNIDNNYHAK